MKLVSAKTRPSLCRHRSLIPAVRTVRASAAAVSTSNQSHNRSQKHSAIVDFLIACEVAGASFAGALRYCSVSASIFCDPASTQQSGQSHTDQSHPVIAHNSRTQQSPATRGSSSHPVNVRTTGISSHAPACSPPPTPPAVPASHPQQPPPCNRKQSVKEVAYESHATDELGWISCL